MNQLLKHYTYKLKTSKKKTLPWGEKKSKKLTHLALGVSW
jgi:hypothetical protein